MKNDSKGLLKRSTFSIDGRVLGPAHTPVKRVRTRAHSTKLHETSSLTKDVRSKKTNVETIRKEKKKEEGIIDSQNCNARDRAKILYFSLKNIYNSSKISLRSFFTRKFNSSKQSGEVSKISSKVEDISMGSSFEKDKSSFRIQTIDRSSRSIPFQTLERYIPTQSSRLHPLNTSNRTKFTWNKDRYNEGVGEKRRKWCGLQSRACLWPG